MNYIDPDELQAEIINSQQQQTLTDYMVTAVHLMVDGLNTRYGWRYSVDLDDLKQDLCLLLLKKINNIDTSKGGKTCFNYITAVMFNHFRQRYRATQTDAKMIHRLIQQLAHQHNITLLTT